MYIASKEGLVKAGKNVLGFSLSRDLNKMDHWGVVCMFLLEAAPYVLLLTSFLDIAKGTPDKQIVDETIRVVSGFGAKAVIEIVAYGIRVS